MSFYFPTFSQVSREMLDSTFNIEEFMRIIDSGPKMLETPSQIQDLNAVSISERQLTGKKLPKLGLKTTMKKQRKCTLTKSKLLAAPSPGFLACLVQRLIFEKVYESLHTISDRPFR